MSKCTVSVLNLAVHTVPAVFRGLIAVPNVQWAVRLLAASPTVPAGAN